MMLNALHQLLERVAAYNDGCRALRDEANLLEQLRAGIERDGRPLMHITALRKMLTSFGLRYTAGEGQEQREALHTVMENLGEKMGAETGKEAAE